jgi:hypothetical protein
MIPAVVIANTIEHLPSATFVYQASSSAATLKAKSKNHLQQSLLEMLTEIFEVVREEAHKLTETQADEIIEQFRSMIGNDFLIEVMENRDARLAGNSIFKHETTTMQLLLASIEDMFYAIILQTTIAQAEIAAFEDEIIAERRAEKGEPAYPSDKYFQILEQRLNAIPD